MLELKESITQKRVKRGLTPERRKFQDSKRLRKRFNIARAANGVESRPPHTEFYRLSEKGIPINSRTGRHYTSPWNRTAVDGKMPHRNGQLLQQATGYIAKSSRAHMRMRQDWWNEGWEALAA